jgi:hypothetical protein
MFFNPAKKTIQTIELSPTFLLSLTSGKDFLSFSESMGKQGFCQRVEDHIFQHHQGPPLDKLTVMIIGRISGVNPTATAIADRKDSPRWAC